MAKRKNSTPTARPSTTEALGSHLEQIRDELEALNSTLDALREDLQWALHNIVADRSLDTEQAPSDSTSASLKCRLHDAKRVIADLLASRALVTDSPDVNTKQAIGQAVQFLQGEGLSIIEAHPKEKPAATGEIHSSSFGFLFDR